MSNDELRLRYLRERVLTASPAQRVVMLYDRLALDLTRAAAEPEQPHAYLDHALQLVAELRSSLDAAAGGPAENLAALYNYLIRELLDVRGGGELERLGGIAEIVAALRNAWAGAADQLAAVTTTAAPLAVGAWVG